MIFVARTGLPLRLRSDNLYGKEPAALNANISQKAICVSILFLKMIPLALLIFCGLQNKGDNQEPLLN